MSLMFLMNPVFVAQDATVEDVVNVIRHVRRVQIPSHRFVHFYCSWFP